jgi:dGTP triphosphohydrolase
MNVFEIIKSIIKEEETDIITNMSYELKENHKGCNEKFDKLMLKIRYEQQKIIIRNICDYIAGMTDSFALDEYNSIKR